jgi:hypothetical protein
LIAFEVGNETAIESLLNTVVLAMDSIEVVTENKLELETKIVTEGLIE